jgi:thioredoxin reductase (NADPH)
MCLDDISLPRFRNRPIAVIGGGDEALTSALYLAKFASVVHVIHRGDRPRAKRIYAGQVTAHPKVRPVPNRELIQVVGEEQRGVTAIRLRDTRSQTCETLEVAGVFPCTGHIPNTAFLAGQLATNPAGYLILPRPPTTATSAEGVFAAGVVSDPRYRQAVNAAAAGCQAALDAQRWLAAQPLDGPRT